MPTEVNDLFVNVIGKEPDGVVKWGESFECKTPGTYVISMDKPISEIPISEEKILNWINSVTNLTLDNSHPSTDDIIQRLTGFWFPDETILYIGQTTNKTVTQRVRQFYRHQLGHRSPHRGGHWIKTLADIDYLNVYWASVNNENPEDVEKSMLEEFMNSVSGETLDNLYDQRFPIPFANLEYCHKKKPHGFKNQTV